MPERRMPRGEPAGGTAPRRIARVALALALAAASPAVGDTAPRSAGDFHLRALVLGAAGPGQAYGIPLSPEAVAALKRGRELRLFDAAGKEIPSLVHTASARSEVVERPVTLFDRGWQENGTQTLSIEVTERNPVGANEFVFDIAEEDYAVRARVEGSSDGASWRILGEGLHLIRHTEPRQQIRYVHNVLRIPTARLRYYRFTLQPTAPPAPGERFEPLSIRGVAVRENVRRGSSLALPVRVAPFEDPRDPDRRHDYWKLDLGQAELGVDHLELTIPGDGFARSASLWEWSPERGRRTRQLASGVLFRFGDDVHTELSGFTSDVRVLVLMIDQGDDRPVEVRAARASRPRQQLRFLGPRSATAPLALYFEADEPRAPRYDLARKLRERDVTLFAPLAHGPLEPNPGYAPSPRPRSERIPYLIYLLVIPLSAGLAWYIARTIQRGVPEESGEPPSSE